METGVSACYRFEMRPFRLSSSLSLLISVPFAAATTACSSSDDFAPWTLEDLTAEKGFSLRTPEFEVPAGEELQDCYFLRVPDISNGEDIWVSRIETAINPGSHHMNLFRVRTIVGLDPEAGESIQLGNIEAKVIRGGSAPTGECWKSGNWADWPLVANSQNSNPDNPYTDWTLPDGVAHRFSPGELLMLQTHYVNATTQRTPFRGRVGVNLHKFSKATPPIELGTLFATQQSIRICRSNPTVHFSGACSFPAGENITITAANGHFHSRGRRFDIYRWDGRSEDLPSEDARFYTSDRWDDPPMATGLQTVTPSGGGVLWTCDFQWAEPAIGCQAVDARDKQMANDCCYTFGPIVEISEHCNAFVYFYPKVEKTDIFCN